VVEIRDQFSLFGPTGYGGISRRPQDQFGLLTRVVLTKVAQELKCDPLVERKFSLPGRPHGEDSPCHLVLHEGASPSLPGQE
jgi:hypothetical protein